MHLHLRLPNHRIRIPFFRIFYSTTFTALTLLLTALLLITPGDHIYQAFRARQIYHIFIVAGFFVLTAIVAILIYGSRLYKTRSALTEIPRDWSGMKGKGASRKVGRLIEEGLERSAGIAYEARPRDMKHEMARKEASKRHRFGRHSKEDDSLEGLQPVWGTITHPGWSSPSSTDLANLHYEPVILELPHLIEAKAVSLAPPDPLYTSFPNADVSETPLADPLTVELLQRPPCMDLRGYINHLNTLGMITPPTLGTDLLTIYEQARFSGEALNEIEFRGLMSVFAEILRNMIPPDPAMVEALHAELAEEETSPQQTDSDAQSLATDITVSHNPLPEEWVSARPDVWTSSSSSSIGSGSEDAATNIGTVHTAPSRRSARRELSTATRASQRRGLHTPSIGSLRRVRSGDSSSRYSGLSTAGSVIRLAEARGPLDLPYEFVAVDELA